MKTQTLQLLIALGVMVILIQPIRANRCPNTNEPPNRGDYRQ